MTSKISFLEKIRIATGRLVGLSLMPLEPLLSRYITNRLVVLFGHFYPNAAGEFDENQIRSNLRFLREHCNVLPLSEALSRLQDGKIPSRSVVLIIDDATRGFYERGWPLLAEAEIPFTLAVIPGLIKSDTDEHYLALLMRIGGHLSLRKEAAILERAFAWLGSSPVSEPGFEFVFREAQN